MCKYITLKNLRKLFIIANKKSENSKLNYNELKYTNVSIKIGVNLINQFFIKTLIL
jgi:hypothetical protein